jgi:hypothetical protein
VIKTRHGGVSGNVRIGSDAIVVSGKRRTVDKILSLEYEAVEFAGAQALRRSCANGTPIRVFRKRDVGSIWYRYGGLFRIACWRKHDNTPDGVHTFYLVSDERSVLKSALKIENRQCQRAAALRAYHDKYIIDNGNRTVTRWSKDKRCNFGKYNVFRARTTKPTTHLTNLHVIK